MMTETTDQAPKHSEPRLAPLDRDDLPSFLVGWPDLTVRRMTSACARLGLSAAAPAPRQAADLARDLCTGAHRHFGLVRLRLPSALAPQLFRCVGVDTPEGPAVLFADPAAPAETPPEAPGETADAMPPADAAGDFQEHVPPEDLLSAGSHAVEEAEASALPPVRFTFEVDADGRLRGLSPGLALALGEAAGQWLGATFPELEAHGRIVSGRAAAEALASGASFSGVRVTTPGPKVLDLELGGVPLFDAARRRVATRGFGVLRSWTRPVEKPRPATAAPTNVVPFSGSLSPKESTAFREIGRTLTAAISTRTTPLPPMETAETEKDAGPLFLRRIEELLDALPFGTLMEREGEAVHANRVFLEWTGWPNLAAVRAVDSLAPLLTEAAPQALRPDLMIRLPTASGALLAVEARSIATPFIAPQTRIHLLRRLDEEMRHRAPAEAARREALDLVPWPLLLLDRGCIIRFANEAAANELGFAPTDLLGQPFTLAIPPEGRSDTIAWIDAVAAADPDAPADTRVLTLRDRAERPLWAVAGLARVGTPDDLMCLVLAPRDPALAAAAEAPVQAPQEESVPQEESALEEQSLLHGQERPQQQSALEEHSAPQDTALAQGRDEAQALLSQETAQSALQAGPEELSQEKPQEAPEEPQQAAQQEAPSPAPEEGYEEALAERPQEPLPETAAASQEAPQEAREETTGKPPEDVPQAVPLTPEELSQEQARVAFRALEAALDGAEAPPLAQDFALDASQNAAQESAPEASQEASQETAQEAIAPNAELPTHLIDQSNTEVAAQVASPPDVQAPAAPIATTAPAMSDASLHLIARRLSESLGAAFSTLLNYTPSKSAEPTLPDQVMDALRTVRQCFADLAALAEPATPVPATACDPERIVREAITHLSPSARRRRITLRGDLAAVPDVVTQPPRLARLVRVMLEEALDATPAYGSVMISLACDTAQPNAPVRLEVSDLGDALDEVALATATQPLAPSSGEDRFSREGRPLRYARMATEAEALQARFSVQRGITRGMTIILELPR